MIWDIFGSPAPAHSARLISSKHSDGLVPTYMHYFGHYRPREHAATALQPQKIQYRYSMSISL